MKYVESINYGWGGMLGFARFEPDEEGSVILRDTDTHMSETASLSRVSSGKYLGAGVSSSGEGVVAKHTPKVVQLYSFVKKAETEFIDPVFEVVGEDLLLVCEEHMLGCKNNGGRTVAINTTNECMELLGLCGSVALRTEEPGGMPQVLTLYGLLGKLCRWTCVNILTYDEIRLYSPGRRYETRIELFQSTEAKRYFLKMFLDVMSGRGLDPGYG